MNIHEYQAKALLRRYGVGILDGRVVYAHDEAGNAARELGGNVWAVKAQIHSGGRGVAGGIKIVKSLNDVQDHAQKMLGMRLITSQTGPEGREIKRLYIEKGCNIARELYMSILIDRSTGRVMIVSSAAGGVDIEETAPDQIIKLIIDPLIGMHAYHARKIAFALDLEGAQISKAVKLILGLYDAFISLDASLIEINPLVVTKENEVLALDVKMTFDDSALYRHDDVSVLRDEDEEDPAELEAANYGLSYIKLKGNIGCLVNGAGLAMATMDVIKLYGGEPANFLDVGGGTPKERVIEAFKLILSDPNVKGIIVNIFGGIMRCDVIAEGIIDAAKVVGLSVPLVVRLEGTNVEIGKKILESSDLSVMFADDLGSAAQKVVKAARGTA